MSERQAQVDTTEHAKPEDKYAALTDALRQLEIARRTLEQIANRQEAEMSGARTLHYDLRGQSKGTGTMTPQELELAAVLLDMASDSFGNKSCNDYELPNTPENYDMLRRARRWNSTDPEEQGVETSKDGNILYTNDYFLMAYLAYRIREALKEVTP